MSSSLTLAAGCTNIFETSQSSLTNDVAKISGALTNGGLLIVTNLGATPLAAGDTFKLLNAVSYNGGFRESGFAAAARGLGWNTSGININSTLAVIIATKPVIAWFQFPAAACGCPARRHGQCKLLSARLDESFVACVRSDASADESVRQL